MSDTTLSPTRSRRGFLLAGGALAFAGIAGGSLFFGRDRFTGTEMSPEEVLAAVRAGEVRLIDIRRPDEWTRTGIPEGSLPLDMRRADFVSALLEITGGRTDAPVALICAAGVRSDRLSARLQEAGFSRIIDVTEGMLGSAAGPGWLARGLPVVQP